MYSCFYFDAFHSPTHSKRAVLSEFHLILNLFRKDIFAILSAFDVNLYRGNRRSKKNEIQRTFNALTVRNIDPLLNCGPMLCIIIFCL